MNSFFLPTRADALVVVTPGRANCAAPARDLYGRAWNHGITCNSILPGTIETPINAEYLSVGSNRVNLERQTCVGSAGRPSDVAGLVAFLARPEARYITGASILVDGGEMVKHL
jgi:NAD(P)-dependent dehydrogenase (short-subunit alcohol dehydrogenase family)